MTNQEYLELLCQSADDGTFPSLDKFNFSCRYRGVGSKRCAIGLLIDDELYQDQLEGYKIISLPREIQEAVQWKVPGVSMEDLIQIQYLHDKHSALPGGWNSNNFKAELRERPCFQKEKGHA